MPGGDVYKLTIWFDRPFDKKYKWGRPNEFAVFISQDGSDIKLLRMLETKIVTIPKKHSAWEVSQRAAACVAHPRTL